MHKIIRKLLGKLNIAIASVLAVLMAGGFGGAAYVLASSTSSFTQTINPGTLAVDIVDGSYASVSSPTMSMNAVTFSFSYQTSTGTFGTASEQLYISNPDAADNGWVVAIAASSTTAYWDSAGTDFDFNDPTASAGDGADADSLGGQMTIDPSGATLAVGQCASCTTGNVTLGSSASYSEDAVDSITIATGAAASDDIGDWTIQGISISQTIPAEQPAASDYSLDQILTITTS